MLPALQRHGIYNCRRFFWVGFLGLPVIAHSLPYFPSLSYALDPFSGPGLRLLDWTGLGWTGPGFLD
jgi:hypothetical protein